MSANSTPNRSFFDFLKPRYHEAICRLKNSFVALVALVTLTHLLPLPTLYTSAWKFYRDSFHSSWEKSLAIAGTSQYVPLLSALTHANTLRTHQNPLVLPLPPPRAIPLLPPPRQHLPIGPCDPFAPSALSASPLARLQVPPDLKLARIPLKASPASNDDASMA